MSHGRTLILCVDRDDDLGFKAAVTGPVIGKEACISAANSLGLIDPERPVKVTIPPNLLPHVSADSVLAVSLEPAGGSPTGQPTGPVIANGKLAAL